MKYYIAINGQPRGPFDHHELLVNGLTATSLVWCEGMSGWVEAQGVPELQELLYGDNHAEERAQTPPPPPRQEQFTPYQGKNEPRYAPGMQAQQMPQQVPLCPKTWLAESILVTIFCCLPCGIVGIVKASQVETLWRQGRYMEAEDASRSAGTWTKVGFFVMLAVYVIYFLVVLIGGLGLGLFGGLLSFL